MEENKQNDEELGENLGEIFKADFEEEEPKEERKPKSLHKIKKNSMIAGVCTGIAEYFDIEPVIVRVLFVVSIFVGGWGIAAYFLAAMLMPSEFNVDEVDNQMPVNNYVRSFTGSIFVFTGIFFIADNFGFLSNIFLFGFPKYFIVPIILVGSGIFLLVKTSDLGSLKSGIRISKLFKSKNDRRIFGVCGGLSEYLNIESNNLRMIWIIFSFITLGAGIILYLFIAALTPTQDEFNLEIQ